MKATTVDLLGEMEAALRACLEGVPFLKIRSVQREEGDDGVRPDLLANLSSSAGRHVLFAEIKESGQPRYARQAANQLHRYLQGSPSAYGIFLAPYVSPSAAAICTQEGIGYADLSGNCRLSFGRIFVEREGRPNRFAEKRDLRSLYSPRATRVLRVLLAGPRKSWRVIDLAREAKVSLGQASNVKKLLADREWLRIGEEGLGLEQPEVLLEDWAANYSFRKNPLLDGYSLQQPAGIEAGLAERCAARGIRYALTGFSGAARMAPAVRYQRVFAFVEGDPQETARQLGLKEAASGANVSLLSPYDEGVFYGVREVEGIWVASPIQVYLDLIGFRGRGEEAARSVLEEVIKPQW